MDIWDTKEKMDVIRGNRGSNNSQFNTYDGFYLKPELGDVMTVKVQKDQPYAEIDADKIPEGHCSACDDNGWPVFEAIFSRDRINVLNRSGTLNPKLVGEKKKIRFYRDLGYMFKAPGYSVATI